MLPLQKQQLLTKTCLFLVVCSWTCRFLNLFSWMCKSECTDYVCFEVNRRVLFNGKSVKGLVGGGLVSSVTPRRNDLAANSSTSVQSCVV